MLTIIQDLPNLTFVSSAQSDNNLSFYPTCYVGTDPAFQDCSAFVQIALPPLAKVDSAFLQLSVIAKSGAEPSPVVLSRVGSTFSTSTVTYNSRPLFTPTASAISVSMTDLYSTVKIDISDLVNDWLSGRTPNYGLMLTNSDAKTVVQFATNIIGYQPYRPKLVVSSPITPITWSEVYSEPSKDES